MPSAVPRSRWRFVISPKWLAWHAFTIAAVIGMLWLGDWQFRRAEAGNALSWAYTFEWPLFAAFGIVFWVKTMIDEGKPKQPAPPGSETAGTQGGLAAGAQGDGRYGAARVPGTAGLPARGHLAGAHQAGAHQAADDDEADDPELDEYNAYLARLSEQVRGHGRWHGLR